MTHYLVKYGEGDIRLYAEDGSEPLSSGWSDWPTANQIADQCASDAPGGSLLGQNDVRAAFVDTVSGGVHRRDLAIEDETVPWQS